MADEISCGQTGSLERGKLLFALSDYLRVAMQYGYPMHMGPMEYHLRGAKEAEALLRIVAPGCRVLDEIRELHQAMEDL